MTILNPQWTQLMNDLIEYVPKNVVAMEFLRNDACVEWNTVKKTFNQMYPCRQTGESDGHYHALVFQEEGAARAFQKLATRSGLITSLNTPADLNGLESH